MKYRRVVKAIAFLLGLGALDFLVRKGLVWQFLPFPLPSGWGLFVSYGLFAGLALLITHRFAKSDGQRLSGIGIAIDSQNRKDFFIGLLVGTVLWSAVGITTVFTAGIQWQLHLENLFPNLLLGFIAILLADLGTELWGRGYGLKTLCETIGTTKALIAVAVLFGLLGYSQSLPSSVLPFAIGIPFLHAVIFGLVYIKTTRLGGALGIHIGGNVAHISLFDYDGASGQGMPPGLLHPHLLPEELPLLGIQLPFVGAAILLLIAVLFWQPASSSSR